MQTFPITTGRDRTPTPEGNFCIITKYKNKEYHRKKITAGAPNNPLGTRWLGLDKKEYAIHGTNREGTIWKPGVEWLYSHARSGHTMVIRPVQLQTKVIISRFHTSPEYEAYKLGYRVCELEWS